MAVTTGTDAFIGGEWIAGDGDEIVVTSPWTGEVVGSSAPRRPPQVDHAVETAAEAFRSWRRTSVLDRVDLCRTAYGICMDRAEEIAQLITRETGKTIRESREEMVEYTADHFRRASEDVLRHAGKVLPSTQERAGAKRIIVVQEPVGVVAAVSPWNFPVDIAGIPLVYGLAVGCTVVWKPSEVAPLCANMFAEVLRDAGFPAGTFNVVHGRGEVGSISCVTGRGVRRVHRLVTDGRAGCARRGSQEPRSRARRQRPADRLRRRRRRSRGRRGDHRVLLPRRPVLHRRRADPRPRVGEGPVRRGAHREDARLARRGSRSTRRRTWGPSASRRCSNEPRRTSPTRSRRVRRWSTAAVTTASSTSRRSSTASRARCGSHRRRRSGRWRRS